MHPFFTPFKTTQKTLKFSDVFSVKRKYASETYALVKVFCYRHRYRYKSSLNWIAG